MLLLPEKRSEQGHTSINSASIARKKQTGKGSGRCSNGRRRDRSGFNLTSIATVFVTTWKRYLRVQAENVLASPNATTPSLAETEVKVCLRHELYISRVSDQNCVSLLHTMLGIHHSGRESSSPQLLFYSLFSQLHTECNSGTGLQRQLYALPY